MPSSPAHLWKSVPCSEVWPAAWLSVLESAVGHALCAEGWDRAHCCQCPPSRGGLCLRRQFVRVLVRWVH